MNEEQGIESAKTRKPGDVFQINENDGRDGWIGCFVMATEIRAWGIQGFVAWPKEHEQMARAFIRLPWDTVEFIGTAPLAPQDTTEQPQ